MALVLAFAVAAAVGALALVALPVLGPRRAARRAAARIAAYGAAPTVTAPVAPPRGGLGLVAPFASLGMRLTPRRRVAGVGTKLAAAGLIRRVSPAAFFALKAAVGLGGVLVGLLLGASFGGAAGAILFAAILGVLGLAAPDVLLEGRISRRREQILVDLPNALDLIAVSVEAGLGLDAALARYVDATEGPLTDELTLLLAELRVGAARADVLRSFADRVAAPEVAAFARAVIHADKLGTSLTETLRVQAVETRLRRQAAAEEKAGKAPVRMLFPTVLFIFPALFVVVLGPALLYLSHAF